jgi:peptidyl-prolyl cis-trans isomerase-like 4
MRVKATQSKQVLLECHFALFAGAVEKMSVLIETSLGNLVIDLFADICPMASLNFLKLCKIKYYNFCVFHSVQRGFTAQTGDPAGSGKGGESIYGILNGPSRKYFKHEIYPKLKHTRRGLVSMAALGGGGKDAEGLQLVNGSQFFITFGDNLDYLDGKYTIFGEVAEGFDVLDKIEDAYVDDDGRPYQDIRYITDGVLAAAPVPVCLQTVTNRIKHTIILDDPFPDPEGLAAKIPDRSPEPTKDMLEVSVTTPCFSVDPTRSTGVFEIYARRAD